MRSRVILRWAVPLLLFGGYQLHLSAQTPNYPSRTNTQLRTERQGFFDYVLGRINPRNKDYGAAFQSDRDAMVENSINNLYFWSNVVTLVLLSGMTAVVFLQWRAMDKREFIAASLIAQLWNGRVSDRIEIERRTQQFNQLVEAHNVEQERSLARKPGTSEQESEKTARGPIDIHAALQGPLKGEANSIQESATNPANLQQEVLLLQRRVEALQNSKENLRQRLNQTTVLLDQERRKNTTLKGA